ncbi:ATP synthase subunit b [Labeo rohita]|uniref:ATP synthase subunit b n=1 Tax=Labeo rohita TaxID=84645 RepID=A0ABQ8M206_LABRO|nr:ATP synthase subunit b [Labeo rohita]
MLSGAAKRKKKKNEEEQKKRQQGALQKFLSGSRPTAVNLLESAEPEAEPGPETRPEDAVEDAAGNAAEDAVGPSTSAPSQKDKLMEEQQPARSEPNIVLQQEPLDPERVLTSYPSDPAKWDQIDDRMHQEVDKESFILLDDHAIASLIPKIGHRVKFQKQHKELVSKMQGGTGASVEGCSVPISAQMQDPDISDTSEAPTEENEDDECWDELEPETLAEQIALFLATLRSKSAQTYSAVSFVVQQTSSLISDIVNSLQRKTLSLFGKLGHEDDPRVQELVSDFEAAASPFRGLESDFKLMQYFAKSGNFIHPLEEALPGVSFVQRRDSATGTVRQVAVQDVFHRVPLKPLLTKLLETQDILDAIFTWQQRENGVLLDFYDGEYCKNHPLFSSDVSVPLLLYNDDCETVNPLGSKVAVHKLGFLYFTIKCLPPQLLSRLSSHFLVAVYKSDDAKTYGIDSILLPVIEELKDLEVNGISLNTPRFKGKMRFSVAQFCRDNLGLNALLEFTESFSSNYFCRICKAHKTTTRTQTKEDVTLMRNEVNHAEDVRHANLSETGVRRDSVLSNLSYFHVTHNQVADIMHDLLEGVGPYELKLVLSSSIVDKHLTLEKLNFRITSFDYGFPDLKNKPSCDWKA